jgi:hypothetical protein
MYLSALNSNKDTIIDKRMLTYYRYHNSTSNLIYDNIYEFNKENLRLVNQTINELYAFKEFASSKKAKSFINWIITSFEIIKLPYDTSGRPKHLFNFLFHFPEGIRHNIMFFGIFITIKIYPKFLVNYVQDRNFKLYH